MWSKQARASLSGFCTTDTASTSMVPGVRGGLACPPPRSELMDACIRPGERLLYLEITPREPQNDKRMATCSGHRTVVRVDRTNGFPVLVPSTPSGVTGVMGGPRQRPSRDSTAPGPGERCSLFSGARKSRENLVPGVRTLLWGTDPTQPQHPWFVPTTRKCESAN